MKRKSSSQIKNMLVLLAILILVILIGLIIFVLNVNIESTSSNDQPENQVKNVVEDPNSNLIATDAVEGIEYNIIAKDDLASYEIVLKDKKLYFNVIDENKFLGKFPKSKVTDIENEIAIHDYKITNIYVGKYNEDEYLLALTEDGALGIMNINDTVEENVFRIKNQLITLGKGKIVNVDNGIKVYDNKEEETMIIEADDGKKYNLDNFVEEK